MGPKQYAFLKVLANADDWISLPEMDGLMITRMSYNHKYALVKDYLERGFLERRYIKRQNKPVALVRITKLGRQWLIYHELGLLYDSQGFFTTRQRIDYARAYDELERNGFVFLRDYAPNASHIIKEYMSDKKRPGQQLGLF